MPIEIKYSNNNTGVQFSAVGDVCGQDIIKSCKEVFQSNEFSKLKYWISDRERCTQYNVSSAEVREISNLNINAAKLNPTLLVAVISENDHQFGISRMYKSYTDDAAFKTSVFRDRQTAKNWINSELNKQ